MEVNPRKKSIVYKPIQALVVFRSALQHCYHFVDCPFFRPQ